MNVCNYGQKQCQGTIKKMLPFVELLIIHDLETVKCVITLSVAYVLPKLIFYIIVTTAAKSLRIFMVLLKNII